MNKPLVLAALALSLAVSACRNDPAPAAAAPAKVEELRIETAAQPHTIRTPVVVRVRTSGEGKGVELRARLIDLKSGQQAGLAVQRIAGPGEVTTELRFEPAAEWSAGRYLIELKLDGKLVEQRDIDLFDPPNG